MQPKLKRGELDHLAKIYSLDQARIETMFDVAGARPTRAEGLAFLGHCLRIGGVLSLASAMVFFVAANWSRLAVFGRFALLELILVACGVLAFARPPPAFAGRGALFVAFITSGALLALFGQTYQTGADVYELFFSWALLGLPLIVLARWSVATAAWVLVFNIALALYCGWQPAGGMLWALLAGPRLRTADVLLAAATLNVALWFVAERWPHDATPDWVRRLVLSCAFAFGSWAGVIAFLDLDRAVEFRDASGFSLPWLASLMAAVAIYTLRRRHDIYPLAVVLGTFIIVSVAGIANGLEWSDEIGLFVLALWLIVTSTIGGRWLMMLMRRWRAEQGT
jgi:uncharacterized membrane protein